MKLPKFRPTQAAGPEKVFHGTDQAFDTLKTSKATFKGDGYEGHVWGTTDKKLATKVARYKHFQQGMPTQQVQNNPANQKKVARYIVNFADWGKPKQFAKQAVTRTLPKERRVVGHVHEMDSSTFKPADPTKMANSPFFKQNARNAGVQSELRNAVPNYRVSAQDAKVVNSQPVREGRLTRPVTQKEADIAAGATVATGSAAGGAYYIRHRNGKTEKVSRPNRTTGPRNFNRLP